ncbi:hypothetical protein K501DRAFT_196819 [Backusella circina FSU 941]|nr:hypothetical protein K501DRAFT_196819 [Backusella circina FSU 941]
MKYSLKNKLDLKSEDGATVLLNYIESKQFITKYRCDPTTNALDGLFVINTTLIARAKQFSELVIIDATYNTNSLRMPLICAYGVSNLGGMVLKAFPIAFLLGYL